jgi:hypothetical protein
MLRVMILHDGRLMGADNYEPGDAPVVAVWNGDPSDLADDIARQVSALGESDAVTSCALPTGSMGAE